MKTSKVASVRHGAYTYVVVKDFTKDTRPFTLYEKWRDYSGNHSKKIMDSEDLKGCLEVVVSAM